ncbi:MAG: acyltransferase family protein [Synechococcus sp.]
MTDNTNPTIRQKNSRYRPEIDGLRALAVIAVIVNHFSQDILPGGYLGVDIFFVISGYVITSSLSERSSKDFKDFISRFYERRIKRLVPALAVFVLTMGLAICIVNPKPELSLLTGIYSLAGLSNLYLLDQSTDYFAQSTELNVFTHTWSLGVEEQFYILFPFLIWLSGFGRQTRNGSRNLALVIGTLSIASLTGFLFLYPTNQSAAYFLMPTRFWEMAAGCLAFLGVKECIAIERTLEKIPPLLTMALMVGVMVLPVPLAPASTLAVVGLSCILIACLNKKTTAFKVLTHPRIVDVGLMSYSLYLWHWGVLSISRWTIGIQWWSAPFQIALMLALAMGSYRWIETPLRHGSWRGRRWATLMIGGGVLMTAYGGLMILRYPLKGKLYAWDSKSQKQEFKPKRSKCSAKATSIFPACIINNTNQPTSNPGKATPKILIVGDSHTKYHVPLAHKLSRELHLEVGVNAVPGYPFPPNNLIRIKSRAKAKPGYELQAKARNLMGAYLKSGDIVLIINSGSYTRDLDLVDTLGFQYPNDQWKGNNQTYFLSRLEHELRSLANSLKKKNISIIYFMPNPSFEPYLIPQLCADPKPYQQFNPIRSDCKQTKPIGQVRDLHKTTLEPLSRAMSDIPNLYFYDPLGALCSATTCSTTIDAVQLFTDGSHLNTYGSERIYPSLSSLMKRHQILSTLREGEH